MIVGERSHKTCIAKANKTQRQEQSRRAGIEGQPANRPESATRDVISATTGGTGGHPILCTLPRPSPRGYTHVPRSPNGATMQDAETIQEKAHLHTYGKGGQGDSLRLAGSRK